MKGEETGVKGGWLESSWLGMGVLGGIVVVFLFDLLFLPGDRVLSLEGADVYRQFAGWRNFGFTEWANGNFPLWTPLVYGGMPYFSGVQSALLYPPNWIFLVMPLAKAINWSIALHLWWVACGVYLWLRYWGARQAAAVFGGVCLMLAAPFFMHVYAGHLTNLCVMAWVPWLIWCVLQWSDSRRLPWVIAGGMVVAMQVFAGHPQYVYYTGLATSIYALLMAGFALKEKRLLFLGGFAAMYVLGMLLSAVQLLPGFEASGEGIRSGGTGKEFAGSYSFPPANLVTLIVPGIFGDMQGLRYWGAWLYWEMVAFGGVIGFSCALIGILSGPDRKRERYLLAGLAVIAAVMALGKYTPLFDVLYHILPGYSLFRGNSKFIFFTAMALAVLAGLGANRLMTTPDLWRSRKLLVTGGIAVVVLWGLGAVVGASDGNSGLWGWVRKGLWDGRGDIHLTEQDYFSDVLAAASAGYASTGFWIAGATVLIFLLLVLAIQKRRAMVYALLVVGIVELVFFAGRFRVSFPLGLSRYQAQAEAVGENADQMRAVDVTGTNRGMLTGIPDLWGDDPGVIARYAEFMALSQGVSPDEASQHLPMKTPSGLWRMLRAKYVFQPNGKGGVTFNTFGTDVLKRFEIVPNYVVISERDAIFEALADASFDPVKTVLLEDAPGIDELGEAEFGERAWTIEEQGTDELVVSVEMPGPGILLMTDPYSAGWRVEDISGNAPQKEYRLMPANYALRAIPLNAGQQRLRIYYWPKTLTAGISLSLLAVIASVGGLLWSRRTDRRGAR